MRTYSELTSFKIPIDRFNYLKLESAIGVATFGFDRYLNQKFYSSREWKRLRDVIISRDNGCDLGIEGFPIHSGLVIHHINPITNEDLRRGNLDLVMSEENLITTSFITHNAIHFGKSDYSFGIIPERNPGDTKLW